MGNKDQSKSQEKFYEGVFSFEFEYPTNIYLSGDDNGRFKFFTSAVRWLGGFPWTVELHYEKSERTGYILYLGAYFNCMSTKSEWKCKTMKGFSLTSPYPDVEPKTWKQSSSYAHSNGESRWGVARLCKWSELPAYAINGRILIEASLKVDKESKGADPHPGVDEKCHKWPFDFTRPHPGITDGVFVLDDGVRVYVSKGFLADCSPDFLNIVNFQKETNQESEEIPMPGVDSYEFIYLLHVLRPSVDRKHVDGKSGCWTIFQMPFRHYVKRKPITGTLAQLFMLVFLDWNVEFLIKLADRFNIPYIMHKCEKFLMKTKGTSDVKKLLLVDQYPLEKLKVQLFRKFDSVDKLKEANKTEEFEKLSLNIRADLLQKLLKNDVIN